MKKMSWNGVKNAFSRCYYFLFWAFTSATFYSVLVTSFKQREFLPLALTVLPVLAALLGFAGLLYNRARALPKGRERQRSLYAAERSMQALVCFFTGTAISSLGAAIELGAKSGPSTFAYLVFHVGVMFELFAFGCFFFAFRTISHKFFGEISMRKIAESVRED